MSIPVISTVETSWDHPDAIALRAAQRAEIAERYGTNDSEPGPAPTAADITTFFVAYVREAAAAADPAGAGIAVGCGGLRQLDDNSGEIKRMFVDPSRRGSGVSVAIVRRLELAARQRGWSHLLLETGDAQPDAVRFYTREGFTPVPNFGHYVGLEQSLCFGKSL